MKRYHPGQDFVGMPQANRELDKPVLTPDQIRRELKRFARLSYRFDVAYVLAQREIERTKSE
jgi:hypothetical protein